MSQPDKQRYFIETVGSQLDYYLTDGLHGVALMIVNQKEICTNTQQGWIKKPHQGFIKMEIARDHKNVLIYYAEEPNPLIVPIPATVEQFNFELKPEHIDKVLEQMQAKGLTYNDADAEYFQGTNTTYSYDREKRSYKRTLMDIIAASFCYDEFLSPAEIKSLLLNCASLYTLREQGFQV